MYYVILVFFFVKDYVIEICRMEEIWILKIEIENIVKMFGDLSFRKLIKVIVYSCFLDMVNIFISVFENGYKLRYMVVYEVVLLLFGENFLEKFLEFIIKLVFFIYVRFKGYVVGDYEVIV